MKGSMQISNETRKALKYMSNITERTGSDEEHAWFGQCPERFRKALQKAVEGFRADEKRATTPEGGGR